MSQRTFTPASWASGPHMQTLMARLLRPRREPVMVRERLPTPDGDFLDVDWGPDPGSGAPVVLVIHGLEGSARRAYVLNVCRELLARGLRPVAMNLRGCSGEPNLLPRAYHSGETGDVSLVLDSLRQRHPDRSLGAWGFSLGGNILLKLMGEREDGGVQAITAAVAMSVPYDLAAGCALMETTRMGRAYTGYFLRSLKRKMRSKAYVVGDLLDMDRVLATRTIREFDDAATAPLHGFESAAAYYASCSSSGFLPGVRTPTLILHSRDDPFLPSSAIPEKTLQENPHLTPVITERGGHVGFLEGTPRRPAFWGDETGAGYLAVRLTR